MELVSPLVFEPFATSFAGLWCSHMSRAHMSPRVCGVGERDATGEAGSPSTLEQEVLSIVELI